MTKVVEKGIVVIIYAIIVLSFIWMDCTHTIRPGNCNYSPESFSLLYSHPISWLIVSLSLGMFLLPWYWRLGYAKEDNSCRWNLFPCSKGNISKVLGIFFSIAITFVTLCAIILTVWIGCSIKWYMEEDLDFGLFFYIFFGIIFTIVNLCFGLFSPKKYQA